MGKLILSFDDSVQAEYEMDKERFTIGRSPDNDIHIDNLAVSGHHAVVLNILNDSFIEDLDSTNGTYVNGKLIKKHALQHGDEIAIGKHTLKYQRAEGEQPEQSFEQTMIIKPGSKSGDSDAPSMDKVNKAIEEAGGDAEPIGEKTKGLPKAKLQVLSGPHAGKELELHKALTTLGRPDVQVAAVTRRAEGFFVVSVDSGKKNEPPKVNGEPLGAQARKLQDNDTIELAGVKMGFYTVD